MFTLDADQFPQDTQSLADALTRSLRRWVDRPAVTMTGVYPALELVEIDLTGATMDTRQQPPDVKPAGDTVAGPTVERFVLVGKPVHAHGVSAQIELTASNARFDLARNRAGEPILVLSDSGKGEFHASITRQDLETAALLAAQAAAQPHGVAVQRVELSLTTPAPREVVASARVTAKKLVTAIIRAGGRAVIDDRLNATVSDLTVDGDGMIAKIVVGLIRPHLQKAEGQQISLLAFLTDSVRLRDLRLRFDDRLELSAIFTGGA